ncbi:hypothetical protein GAMM_40277 [Gammaproteobacteria bacterium]
MENNRDNILKQKILKHRIALEKIAKEIDQKQKLLKKALMPSSTMSTVELSRLAEDIGDFEKQEKEELEKHLEEFHPLIGIPGLDKAAQAAEARVLKLQGNHLVHLAASLKDLEEKTLQRGAEDKRVSALEVELRAKTQVIQAEITNITNDAANPGNLSVEQLGALTARIDKLGADSITLQKYKADISGENILRAPLPVATQDLLTGLDKAILLAQTGLTGLQVDTKKKLAEAIVKQQELDNGITELARDFETVIAKIEKDIQTANETITSNENKTAKGLNTLLGTINAAIKNATAGLEAQKLNFEKLGGIRAPYSSAAIAAALSATQKYLATQELLKGLMQQRTDLAGKLEARRVAEKTLGEKITELAKLQKGLTDTTVKLRDSTEKLIIKCQTALTGSDDLVAITTEADQATKDLQSVIDLKVVEELQKLSDGLSKVPTEKVKDEESLHDVAEKALNNVKLLLNNLDLGAGFADGLNEIKVKLKQIGEQESLGAVKTTDALNAQLIKAKELIESLKDISAVSVLVASADKIVKVLEQGDATADKFRLAGLMVDKLQKVADIKNKIEDKKLETLTNGIKTLPTENGLQAFAQNQLGLAKTVLGKLVIADVTGESFYNTVNEASNNLTAVETLVGLASQATLLAEHIKALGVLPSIAIAETQLEVSADQLVVNFNKILSGLIAEPKATTNSKQLDESVEKAKTAVDNLISVKAQADRLQPLLKEAEGITSIGLKDAVNTEIDRLQKLLQGLDISNSQFSIKEATEGLDKVKGDIGNLLVVHKDALAFTFLAKELNESVQTITNGLAQKATTTENDLRTLQQQIDKNRTEVQENQAALKEALKAFPGDAEPEVSIQKHINGLLEQRIRDLAVLVEIEKQQQDLVKSLGTQNTVLAAIKASEVEVNKIKASIETKNLKVDEFISTDKDKTAVKLQGLIEETTKFKEEADASLQTQLKKLQELAKPAELAAELEAATKLVTETRALSDTLLTPKLTELGELNKAQVIEDKRVSDLIVASNVIIEEHTNAIRKSQIETAAMLLNKDATEMALTKLVDENKVLIDKAWPALLAQEKVLCGELLNADEVLKKLGPESVSGLKKGELEALLQPKEKGGQITLPYVPNFKPGLDEKVKESLRTALTEAYTQRYNHLVHLEAGCRKLQVQA